MVVEFLAMGSDEFPKFTDNCLMFLAIRATYSPATNFVNQMDHPSYVTVSCLYRTFLHRLLDRVCKRQLSKCNREWTPNLWLEFQLPTVKLSVRIRFRDTPRSEEEHYRKDYCRGRVPQVLGYQKVLEIGLSGPVLMHTVMNPAGHT